MDISTQARIAISVGVTSFIVLVSTGMFLPAVLSSQLPLFLILLIAILFIVAIPACLFSFIYFLVKKKRKKGKKKKAAVRR